MRFSAIDAWLESADGQTVVATCSGETLIGRFTHRDWSLLPLTRSKAPAGEIRAWCGEHDIPTIVKPNDPETFIVSPLDADAAFAFRVRWG